MLTHPDLTGMPRDKLDALTTELAEPQARHHEQARHTRRGADRTRARGAGRQPRLSDADRVLATVLYLRRLCTQAVLGELFAVDRTTITTAVRQTRALLQQHGHAITPSTARFPTAADLIAYVADSDTEPPTTNKISVLILSKP
jgi:hypothetical protein